MLSKEIAEILSIQQRQFLAPSSKVFSDTNKQLKGTSNEGSEMVAGRPISAKVLIKKHRDFVLKRESKGRAILSGKSQQTEGLEALTEKSILSKATRIEHDFKKYKRSTYIVRNPARIPDGITGHRAKTLIPEDKQIEIEREIQRVKDSPFSPFLMYPMEEKKENAVFENLEHHENTKFFSLEYFIFPPDQDREDLPAMYLDIKKKADQENRPVLGFSKYFDLKGKHEWKQCELVNFFPDDDLFEIRWKQDGGTKKVTRSNFYYADEDSDEYSRMVENAKKWREFNCIYLKYNDLIDRIDTPTPSMQPDVKDKILALSLDIPYSFGKPRDPKELAKLPLKERYNFTYMLANRMKLNIPQHFDAVEKFKKAGFSLNTVNRISEEMEDDFSRANHQIEFHLTLPYSKERQSMFMGYFPDELFVPLNDRTRVETDDIGLKVKTITHKQYLRTFEKLKSSLHQASPDRQVIIENLSKELIYMDDLCFIKKDYEEGLSPVKFLLSIDYASQDCSRRVEDVIAKLNSNVNEIVRKELDKLKEWNRMVNEKFTVETQKIGLLKKDLDPDVVDMITNYLRLLNFKMEYRLKLLLRRSLDTFNNLMLAVLNKFKTVMELKSESINFREISYETILEYQLRTQYEEFDTHLPNCCLKLKLKEKSIVFEDEFYDLKEKLIALIQENITKVGEFSCLNVMEIGPARHEKLVKVLIDEQENTSSKSKMAEELLDQVLAMFEVFHNRVKEFDYVFGYSLEKVGSKLMKFSQLKKTLLKLKKIRNDSKQVFFKDRLNVGLFTVDCTDFRVKLEKQIARLISFIINMLIETISKENEKLAEEVNSIRNKLSEGVNTLQELEILRDYATHIEKVLDEIMTKIREIMDKLNLVEEMQHRISYEQFARSWSALALPNEIREKAKRTLIELDKKEKYLAEELREFQGELERSISQIGGEFDRLNKSDSLEDTDRTSQKFLELGEKIEKALIQAREVQDGERILNQSKPTDYSLIEEIKKSFIPFNDFWQYAANYNYKYLQRLEGSLEDIDRDEFTQEIMNTWNSLFRLEKSDFKLNNNMSRLCKEMRDKYSELKPFLPLIYDLKNPSLETRHWRIILSTLGFSNVDEAEVQKIEFNKFIEHGARDHMDEIRDISETATKERGYVKIVGKLKKEWKNREFRVDPYKDSGKFLIVGIDPILDSLDEDIAKLSSILSSPNVKFFEKEIKTDRDILIDIQEIIELWIKVQKHWQYLLPIFSSEDIKHERQDDSQKFDIIDSYWCKMMEETKEMPPVLDRCKKPKLKENLEYCFNIAEEIIKSLNDYLNSKRACFPRFYFLPNEELLQILSQTRDVRMIQRFLSKCFEGIEFLTFTSSNVITHMNSSMDESLMFVEEVDPNLEGGQVRNVEIWLSEVEDQMRITLKHYYENSLEAFDESKKAEWVLSWPSQIVLAAGQTFWTSEVEESIQIARKDENALNVAYRLQREKLMAIVEMIQNNIAVKKKDIMTLEVLIVLEVHGLDVIEDLQKAGINNLNAFEWISQLRYYNNKKTGLSSVMINTERVYGWEYLGNQGRLVITPLTDRCYRTLMSALQMNLGGAPEGPAGTGKTETTKDLAKALAKQCVVFNCSEELDIGQMSKFFMGLTSCGSWTCFDEFNRIELEVLSVIAQQILSIQTNIMLDQERKFPLRKFTFNGTEVKLEPSCAIFITMNPGYAGRSELPDNLKRLFRSIAMMIPNYSMIAEISLYSYGFLEAREYSVKIVQSLRLSSEQLSTQSHYDFGMRSVKAILVAAGNLKRKFPNDKESSLIMRAICDCTVPKFTTEDTHLFNNIMADLFPTEKMLDFNYGDLNKGIRLSANEHSLKLDEDFLSKIIQLYETIRVRHGLMLVGETFSGKTSVMKLLQEGWQYSEKITALSHQIYLNSIKDMLDHQKKGQPIKIESFISFLRRTKHEEEKIKEPHHELTAELSTYLEELDDEHKKLLDEWVEYSVKKLTQSQINGVENKKSIKINIDRINPKAISSKLMYGETDENSGDWKQGIAAKIFKECSDDFSGALRWVVFDGPVDANWIESMNTVLDDNKKLCLANSEVIKLTDKMSIVFEVEDLAEASLATVSRCGMIYMERKILSRQALYEKWYADLPEIYHTQKHKELFDSIFNAIFLMAIQTASELRLVMEMNQHHLLASALRVFEAYFLKGKNRKEIQEELESLKEKEEAKRKAAELVGEDYHEDKSSLLSIDKGEVAEIFAAACFACIWGIGSIVQANSRDTFSSLIGSEIRTSIFTTFKNVPKEAHPPDTSDESLYDCYYAFDTKNWQPFIRHLNEMKLEPEMRYSEIFIPTKDSIRNKILLDQMIKQEFPILFFGKTGTAKTQIVKRMMLEGLDPDRYIPLITVLSANTKREQLQDVLESKLEKQKRAKGIYGPVVGKKNIIFVDDLNMPQKEKFGAQPPLELLRQWFDDKGWYDRKTLEYKTIEDLLFISGMGLGRPDIPRRLYRHFFVQYVFEYDRDTVKHVFKSIFSHFYHYAPEPLRQLVEPLTNICVEIYENASRSFLPLPGKSHYLFNLRDLSKVVQGITSVPVKCFEKVDNLYSKVAMLVHYEAEAVFSDRFVSLEDRRSFSQYVKSSIGKFLRKSYDSLVEEAPFYTFGNFMEMHDVSKQYDVITDREKLKEKIQAYIDEYNEISKKKINILLFEEAIEKLTKYNRIISREYGHGLFIGLGGDGRKTLSRLASYMQDFALEEPETKKSIPSADWLEYLKEAFKKTGVEERPTVLLLTDSQLDKDAFYEDINNILNIGEVPNLYKADDIDSIINDLRQKFAKTNKRNLSSTAIWEEFLLNCKINLHLIITSSSIGEGLRLRMRAFPSLINCSSIIWHLAWSGDSLAAIARSSLMPLEPSPEQTELLQGFEEPICRIFVGFHKIVEGKLKQFYSLTGKSFYVTPINYNNTLQIFKKLLGTKKKTLMAKRDKYRNGVQKLDECAQFVDEIEAQLAKMRPEQVQKAEEVTASLKIVEIKREEAELKRSLVTGDREKAENQQQKADEIASLCKEKLAVAEPEQEIAKRKLDTLNQNHFVEMKSYKEIPEKPMIILEGVLRLLGYLPKKKQKKEKYFKDKAKSLINTPKQLLDKLRKFQVESSEDSAIEELEQFIEDNSKVFDKIAAHKLSVVYGVMCEWVFGNLNYYKVYQSILPLRQDLAKANEELVEANNILQQKMNELAQVEQILEDLENSYKQTLNEKNQLEKDIKECSAMLERSLRLKNGLSGERDRWDEQANILDQEISNILGDIILGSGCIAYLGPFSMQFRNDIIKQWRALVDEEQIFNSGDKFNLIGLIGDEVKIQQWNMCKLPFDETSIENSLIMHERSDMIPLVIDPQQQFLNFIKAYEKQNVVEYKGTVREYKANVKKLDKKLIDALQIGAIMILENVSENIDPCFDHLLDGEYTYSGGITYVQVGPDNVAKDINFKLYLISNLNSPHYTPTTLSKVNYLDFTVTPGGLKEQMLSIVCKKEKPKDEEDKFQIMRENTENRQQQKDLEQEILDLLSESNQDFVKNDQLVNSLTKSKENSKEIDMRLLSSAIVQEKIEKNRNNYKPLAELTTYIYFIIKELYKWEPMYQFSLQWFQGVFLKSIHDTQKQDSKNIEKRIEDLKAAIMLRSFKEICRSLFVKHKPLFAFLLATTYLRCNEALDESLLQLILLERCKSEMDIGEVKPNPIPEIIEGKLWEKVTQISHHPSFSKLSDFVASNGDYFIQFLDSLDSRDAFLKDSWPEEILAIFTILGALAFIKIFRPDLFQTYMKKFIKDAIGEDFVQEVVISLEESYSDSCPSKPLLYILSPGDDPHEELKKYANDKSIAIEPISLGKGQGDQARDMIFDRCKDDCWVILQNCHLAISWLPELELIIETLNTPEVEKRLAPGFRLFLTAAPTDEFPLSILQECIKMTKDPPKGIRANVRQIYANACSSRIEKTNFADVPSEKMEDWQTLFMSLSFFHAVVRERRRYGPVGWNIPYDFNESDFKISVKQLKHTMLTYTEIPFKALHYLTSECYYGGKVTDSMDRTLLNTILDKFYNESVLKDKYNFSSKDYYYIPQEPMSLEQGLEFIESLPDLNEPELYGLHANAAISSAIDDTKEMISSILLISSNTDEDCDVESQNKELKAIAKKYLERMPEPFDAEDVKLKNKLSYQNCMNTVLLQEILRYNNLVVAIRVSLNNLIRASEGLIVMTLELEEMGNSVRINQVPAIWNKKSYPSLKSLSSYFDDLLQRIEMFRKWAYEGAPNMFWVPGLFFTQSFFTGVLQQYARKMKISIDELEFKHQVEQEFFEANAPPVDGCFIYGLFMEGTRIITLKLEDGIVQPHHCRSQS